MSSLQLETAALGRPFALGMLYNAHKEQLITDFTIWDKETIETKKDEQIQSSSEFKVIASDSLESKSSLLDVNASLKASFLGGLIEIGGSASYLNDKKKFKNQSRITLQYKATTAFKRLTLTLHEAQTQEIIDVIEKSGATHVVTGILYGTNAFFVFDSEKLDSNNVRTIEVSMEAAMKKIPSLSLEAKASTKLSDEEKAVTNKFSCKFYGDLVLDRNPATFEDAVATYSKLPELLKENSVPVRVWLTPLKNLVPSAAEMKQDLSTGLLRKAQNSLEGIIQMEMRCNEALEEEVVKSFPQIHKRLRRFQHLCEDYTTKLRKTMREKIPLIRDGKENEATIEKLVDDQEKSPFSQENLDKWLDNIEREINVIRSCVGFLEGIKIVTDESELDREVFAAGVDEAFCFVFTSVQTDDPYLDQITDYLSWDLTQTPAKVTPPSKDHWFFSHEVFSAMTQKAKEFSAPARRLKSNSRFCFTVAALPNDKFKGATIYQYKDHHLKTEDFSKPVSNVKAVTDKRDLLWYGCIPTLDPNTASGYLHLSHENRKATCGEWKTYPEKTERFDPYPQVLCKEGLTGRHYFEVEWSTGHNNNNVGIALAYRSIPRKGNGDKNGFGTNDVSWYFGIDNVTLRMWYNNQRSSLPVPSSGCSRIGVYLDWSGGSLSFYNVSTNTLTHMHTFKANFTEPLYPGLYVWNTFNHAAFCSI